MHSIDISIKWEEVTDKREIDIESGRLTERRIEACKERTAKRKQKRNKEKN